MPYVAKVTISFTADEVDDLELAERITELVTRALVPLVNADVMDNVNVNTEFEED